MARFLQTRQPYKEPTHPGKPSVSFPTQTIKFLHPGYKDTANILFTFDAYDANSGFHYYTAHTACAIVANNRWDGYFSIDIEGTQRVEPSGPDESLQSDAYYFQVPGGWSETHSSYSLPANTVQTKFTLLCPPSPTGPSLTVTCLQDGSAPRPTPPTKTLRAQIEIAAV